MDEVIVVCYSGDQRPALNWSTELVLVAALVKELSTYSAHELQRRAAELEDGRVKKGDTEVNEGGEGEQQQQQQFPK